MINNKTKEDEQQRVNQVISHIEEQYHHNQHVEHEVIKKGQELVLQSNELKIKDGSESSFRESSFAVIEREKELLFLEQQAKQLAQKNILLERMKYNPYFGRIDILEEGQEKSYYLGMSSFSYNQEEEVIDWRSPIASVFYNQTLGHQTYDVDEEQREIDVVFKRQFIIENQQITVMADTEETIVDDVLLETLAKKATPKMKEITATIQEEQNIIIRDLHHSLIMIQGVAGSGKTAVLLQRLAYLLYHRRQTLNHRDILMLSPNPIFSDYISNVLPALGEDDVYRRTFYDWLTHDLLSLTIQPSSNGEYILNDERCIQAFFTYLQQLEEKGLQYQPIYRQDGKMVLSRKMIAQLFKQLPSMPIKAKIKQLQRELLRYIDQQKEGYLYSDELDDRFNIEGSDYLDQYQQELEQLSEDKVVLHIKQKMVEKEYAPCETMIRETLFIDDYKQGLHFFVYLQEQGMITKELVNTIVMQWQKQQASLESAQWLLIISQHLKEQWHVPFKAVFIDEVQDYTPLTIFFITTLLPHAQYTLCGDEQQLIYQHDNKASLFADYLQRPMKHYHLQTSYRSTVEITQFADAILQRKSQAKVMRHGPKPVVMSCSVRDGLKRISNQKVAIVTRTKEKAHQLATELGLVQMTTTIPNQSFVASLKQVKGLEFDCVIMTETNEATKHERYTMATRAMHELYIIDDQSLSWLSDMKDKYDERD